jgi:2-(1,2-epoxy-1,2-dihydrophenyl)acetyl-CoA isomerase
MSEQSILLSVADGVAEITLNRPERLNSFTASMHAALRAALARARADSAVRALLLTGAGRGFCAGQDLDDVVDPITGQAGGVVATIEENYNPLINALQEAPWPVVCAVNGVAAGAGANIALACDLVIAARSASFIQAFVKIGLVPDAGGSYFLPRLVGTARAVGMAMTGDRVGADDAQAWGLIWKVVDDAELMPHARALARHLAAQPTRALVLIKRQMQASLGNSLESQLALEARLQGEAAASSDYREGVAAFLAKRKPTFTGQ